MSRMDLRQLNKFSFVLTPRNVLVGVIASFTIWFPSKTDYYEFIHMTEPLSISISENAPPRALLEDEQIQPLITLPLKQLVSKKGTTILRSGERNFYVDENTYIAEIKRVQTFLVKQKTPEIQTPVLAAVSNEKPTSEKVSKFEFKELPTISFFSVAEAAKSDVTPENPKYEGSKIDTVPSFGDAFKTNTIVIKTQEHYQPSNDFDSDEELPVVYSPPKKSNGSALRIAAAPPAAVLLKNVKTNLHPSEPKKEEAPYRVVSHEDKASSTESARKGKPNSQVIFSGAIEFANGLALVDGASLEVFHEVSGQPMERGQVLVKQGQYEIFLQDHIEGSLVAEVRDNDQQLLGKSEISLNEIDYSNLENGIRKRLNLKLMPVATSIEGRVSSYYSPTKGEADAEVLISGFNKEIRTDKKGRFSRPQILHGSQILIATHKTDHWGSLVIADNKKDNNLRIYPNKMIQALAELTSSEKNYEDFGIIWGRVESSGQALSGVTVETTSYGAIGPIYFNALQIPDLDMKETGSNGLFAFLQVEPGLQIIRAKNKGRVFPAKAVVVDQGMVSQSDIELTTRKRATARIYDALSGAALSADVSFSGVDKSAHVSNGYLGVKYHTGSDLMFLEADASSEYLPVRQILSRDVSYINFAMLKRSFVEDMINAARISRVPHSGTAIGFVRGADYEVFLPEGSRGEILYFNSEGVSIGRESGVRNGGFVLTNLTPGIQTIGIAAKGKKALVLKLILSDSTRASLINYKF